MRRLQVAQGLQKGMTALFFELLALLAGPLIRQGNGRVATNIMDLSESLCAMGKVENP